MAALEEWRNEESENEAKIKSWQRQWRQAWRRQHGGGENNGGWRGMAKMAIIIAISAWRQQHQRNGGMA